MSDTSGARLAAEAALKDAAFDVPAALSLYSRAVRASPLTFRYQLALSNLYGSMYGVERSRSYLMGLTTGDVRRCWELFGTTDWDGIRALRSRPAARECANFMLMASRHEDAAGLAFMAERSQHALLGRELVVYVDALQRAGRANDGIKLLKASIALEPAPRDRVILETALIDALRANHQVERAAELEHTLRAALERSQMPGLLYFYLMNTRTAPNRLERAAQLAVQHHAFAMCSTTLHEIVSGEIDAGEMQQALRDAPRFLRCADQSGSDFQRANARTVYGRALAKAGNQEAAEKMLLAAWPYARRSGPRYVRADVWHNLAHVYEAEGRWRDARRAVDRFSHTVDPNGDSQEIVSYRDAGVIYWESGDRSAARTRFEKMLQLIETFHHEYYWAGEYYERIGDLARARAYYLRALAREGNEARKTAGLVRVYLALEELDSAAAFARLHDSSPLTPEEVLMAPVVDATRGNYPAALAAAAAWVRREEAQRNVQGAINAHLQRAEIALAAGQYALARADAQRADTLALVNHLRREAARALVYIGSVENAQAISAGKPTLRRAIIAARAAGEDNLLSLAWSALGDAQLRDNDARGALVAFDSAGAASRRTARHFEDSFDRARYATAMSRRLTDAAWRAVSAGRPDLLYEWSVRRKTSAPPAQTLAGLRARLGVHDALLDYIVADSGVAALVVTRDTAAVVRLPVSRASLRALVQRFRGSIAVSFGNLDRTRSHFDYASASRLYDVVLRPLVGFLRGHERWSIVPDDALHLVPFDAFVNRSNRTFVVDRATTTYLSAPDAGLPSRRVDLQNVVVFGATTPGLNREIAAIRNAVPRAHVLIDPAEPLVSRTVGSASVLHFAVHAEADARQPQSSFLQVGSNTSPDGQYRFNQIAADHNRADLVVLSACETLYGRLFAGGPMSLASAFALAGAKAVVATQWPVGEKSSDFTSVLYRELARGKAPADAVRSARLAMRRAPGSDPIFWAPFELLAGRAAF